MPGTGDRHFNANHHPSECRNNRHPEGSTFLLVIDVMDGDLAQNG
jgi:hypothetical protein